jgi:protoheme ferro-lyase
MTLQNYKHWLNAMRDAALAIQQHEFKTARLRANRDELAAAKKTKSGSWRFRVRCGSKYWQPIAKQMLNELAAREGVDYVDLQASISLPERGRSFTKSRGEKHISSHG